MGAPCLAPETWDWQTSSAIRVLQLPRGQLPHLLASYPPFFFDEARQSVKTKKISESDHPLSQFPFNRHL
jgi:hypothetical protein